jgi:hypothetical protein
VARRFNPRLTEASDLIRAVKHPQQDVSVDQHARHVRLSASLALQGGQPGSLDVAYLEHRQSPGQSAERLGPAARAIGMAPVNLDIGADLQIESVIRRNLDESGSARTLVNYLGHRC